jgi:hypothetical protein
MVDQTTKKLPPGFDRKGRPETVEAAEKAVNDIRSDRGHVSDRDLRELAKTDAAFQQDYMRKAENTRDVYARFTRV